MKVEKKLSIREYSALIKVDESAVRKAIKAGKITKGYDVNTKQITPSIANKEYGNLHKVAKPRPGQNKSKLINKLEDKKVENKSAQEKTKAGPVAAVPEMVLDGNENLISSMAIDGNLAYSETLRRRELIGLVQDKLKLQELERALVRKSDVESALFTMADLLKKALLNIPSRTIADIRCAGNDVEAQQILTVEIIQVLNQYSNIKELKI